MIRAILLDRKTILNPIQLAAALVSYQNNYPEIWIIENDYQELICHCLFDLAYRYGGFNSFCKTFKLDHFDEEAIVSVEGANLDWDELFFQAKNPTCRRQNVGDRAILGMRHLLNDSGVPNSLASRALIEESKKRRMIKVAPQSMFDIFFRSGADSLVQPYNKILLKGVPVVLKKINESNKSLGSYGNSPIIDLSSKEFIEFYCKNPDSHVPKWYIDLPHPSKEEVNRFHEKLQTWAVYIGASLHEGWTIHCQDRILTKWLIRNVPVELIPPRAPLKKVRQAIAFKPNEFTVGDIFKILEEEVLLDKLSGIQDAIDAAEKGKQAKKDLLFLVLSLISGGVAGTVASAISRLESVQQVIERGSETAIDLTSYLFKRKPKKGAKSG